MPAPFQSRIILGGLVLLVLAGAYYAFFRSPSTSPTTGACPADARQCPDGTYVGRTGPSCEFAVCPSGATTTDTQTGSPSTMEVKVRFAETGTAGNLHITPTTLLEDSRCPLEVQCIQAGTVRIRASIQGPSGTSEPILALGIPVAISAGTTVTLIGVYPAPAAGKALIIRDYQFTLRITSR